MRILNRTIRITAVAAVAALAGATMLMSSAWAQSPPTPPSRFVGSVTVNGVPAAAGTTIEARIGSTTCGVTTVFLASGQSRYALDSPALEPAANPNCGTVGAAVAFYVGGQKANETGSWANFQLNTVNLTVTPAATTTTTAVPATPTRTPGAPVAGTTAGTGAASVPLVGVLLLATALGLAGVGVAARVRRD